MLIITSNHECQEVIPEYPTVIVGVQCGVAIMRGAQAYAPGVIAMPNGICYSDLLSSQKNVSINWYFQGWWSEIKYLFLLTSKGNVKEASPRSIWAQLILLVMAS